MFTGSIYQWREIQSLFGSRAAEFGVTSRVNQKPQAPVMIHALDVELILRTWMFDTLDIALEGYLSQVSQVSYASSQAGKMLCKPSLHACGPFAWRTHATFYPSWLASSSISFPSIFSNYLLTHSPFLCFSKHQYFISKVKIQKYTTDYQWNFADLAAYICWL